jgi:hypothetical protein
MTLIRLLTLLLTLVAAPAFANGMVQCEESIREGNESMAYTSCLAAAKEGNPKAQVLVGMAVMNGIGVFKDPAAAVGWFKLSADQKYPSGMYYLAMTKIAGLGTPMDEKGGMALMRRAAEAGEPRAKDFLTQIGEAQPSAPPPKKLKRFECNGVGCGKPIDGMPR